MEARPFPPTTRPPPVGTVALTPRRRSRHRYGEWETCLDFLSQLMTAGNGFNYAGVRDGLLYI